MMGPEHESSNLRAKLARAESGKDAKENVKKQKFSLSYGFFVVMGGISVSTEHLHPTKSSITLTCEGVELLAREGHFINISENEIADRSKANPLGKALVCVQTVWMVLQCSVRAANGYPLTLLEINTMVHVFCAILIYLLWWKKPLDVTVPCTVNSSGFDEVLALIMMCTAPKYDQDAEIRNLVFWRPPLLEGSDEPVETDELSNQEPAEPTSNRAPEEREPKRLRMNRSIVLEPGERLSCGFKWGKDNVDSVTLTTKDCKRWILCSNALCRNQVLREGVYPIQMRWRYNEVAAENWHDVFMGRSARDGGVTDYIATGLSESIIMDAKDLVRLFAFHVQEVLELLSIFVALLFPACYSGVHFAASNFAFPTNTESVLWRIACIGIMAFVPCVTVMSILVYYLCLITPKMTQKLQKFHNLLESILVLASLLGLVVLVVFVSFFVLARAYLVVEAFISLRKAPLGVFVTITWLQSIPHI